MKHGILTALVFCLLAAGAASAQTYVYKLDNTAVFSVDIPEGWEFSLKPTVRDPGVRRLSGTAPTGLVWFGTWVLKDAKTINEAVDYLRTTAKNVITNAKEKKAPVDGEINGMKTRHFEFSGTMKPDGTKTQNFEARAVLFDIGGGRVGIAVCMSDGEGLQAQKVQIEGFFNSLRASK